MNEAFIELRDITKDFGGVHALRGVNMQIPEGQVTAIVGDNGAGKSTLISCLSGLFEPSSGHIFIDGVEVRITSPIDSRHHGIETVYQDLALAPDLDAPANVFLGREITRLRWLHDTRKMRQLTESRFKELGVGLVQDMRVPVAAFSGGQKQSVAIARAAMWAEHVIIMDEPTAALGVVQTANVLRLIETIRDRGLAVVLISHNLPEVLQVADRIEVMRLGARVARFRKGEADAERLIAAMTGSYATEMPA